jgi:hypothetical protein
MELSGRVKLQVVMLSRCLQPHPMLNGPMLSTVYVASPLCINVACSLKWTWRGAGPQALPSTALRMAHTALVDTRHGQRSANCIGQDST